MMIIRIVILEMRNSEEKCKSDSITPDRPYCADGTDHQINKVMF